MVHGLTILSYVICGTWGFLALGVRFADITQNDKKKHGDSEDKAEETTHV